MKEPRDGRRFVPEVEARVEQVDGRAQLLAPKPGYYRDAPPTGSLVSPGAVVGVLEVLGVQHRVRAPRGAFGVVDAREGKHVARRPVGYGDLLCTLDPEAVGGETAAATTQQAAGASGPVFESPLGGRYYARPAPDAPPFLEVGQKLSGGETVAIVEVMKTFNRVTYDGPPAEVARIVPNEGDDIDMGAVLLELRSPA